MNILQSSRIPRQSQSSSKLTARDVLKEAESFFYR